MSKREYGDGAIYQRESDGRYVSSLRVDGRRKYFYGPDRKTVKARLEQFKREREAGIAATNATRQTVSQYLDYWLEVRSATIEESTLVSYASHLRCVHPHIGHIKLVHLTTDQVQALYGKLQLAPNTIRLIHTILSSAFKDAVTWRRLSINPCKGAKPPKAEETAIQFLTAEQAGRLMEAAQGTPLEGMIALAVTTGMRRGELRALRWSDINFEQQSISVKRTAAYISKMGETPSHYAETDPKTASSRRQIALPPFVVSALKAHRGRQREQRWQAGAAWQERGLVFPNSRGNYFFEKTLYAQFAALLEQADLPPMRFHDLRHSAATILLSQGVHPKVVQELLGHSNIQVTMNTYSHVLPTIQRSVMNDLDVLYFGLGNTSHEVGG